MTRYQLDNFTFYNYDFPRIQSILVDKGKIIKLEYTDKKYDSFRYIDLNRMMISPGLIDIQVNGTGDCLFTDKPEPSVLSAMADDLLKRGITSFLPTVITTSYHNIIHAAETVDKCMKDHPNIIGLHIEGPFINAHYSGFHNKDHIFTPSPEDVKKLIETCPDCIRMITLAPEIVSAEIIRYLTDHNIVVSAGHSSCTYDEAEKSFDSGVRCVTHLWNAMPPLSSREPGLIGAVFDAPDVYCTVINDGHHIAQSNLNLTIRLKNAKTILISDQLCGGGSSGQHYTMYGRKICIEDSRCYTLSDNRLAGSGSFLDEIVYHTINNCNISRKRSVSMASSVPADLLRIKTGRIEEGMAADIVISDFDMNIKKIMLNGDFV